MRVLPLLGFLGAAAGHGSLTYPPSRHGGSLAEGGHCDSTACMWFSQPASIPGAPTVNEPHLRTYNVDVRSGPTDWSATMPWRAPGTAPVFGSGCGIAGGSYKPLPNGGAVSPSMPPQGTDGLLLPRKEPTVWRRGSEEEVAWAINANHGGGYSYRLCSLDGVVNETCFRQTVLRFAGGVQWIQYNNQTYQYDDTVKLPRFELPRTTTTKGTYPPGSEWARVGVPSCRLCDQSICGPGLKPNMSDAFQPGYWMGNATMYGGREWFEEEQCAQHCAGHNMSACPPFMTQFAEPLPGISGYTGQYAAREGLPFSLVDRVIVPPHLKPGAYLMSWRWDAEQSHQVWQSCADIQIV